MTRPKRLSVRPKGVISRYIGAISITSGNIWVSSRTNTTTYLPGKRKREKA